MKRLDYYIIAKKRLIARRETLLRYLNEQLPLVGRSDDVTDSCDDASDAEFDNVFSQLAHGDSRELAAIENALDRLQHGQYGRCDECGGPIPLARLQALPFAASCIECQRQRERGGLDGCSPRPTASYQI